MPKARCAGTPRARAVPVMLARERPPCSTWISFNTSRTASGSLPCSAANSSTSGCMGLYTIFLLVMGYSFLRHCERRSSSPCSSGVSRPSEAISPRRGDCFVGENALLAMTDTMLLSPLGVFSVSPFLREMG